MVVPLACGDDADPGKASTGSGGETGSTTTSGDGGLSSVTGLSTVGGNTTTANASGGFGNVMNEGGHGDPAYIFDATYGGDGLASPLDNMFPRDVAIDSSGNIVVAGTFTGTIDFGDGTPDSSAGGDDAFVAKYDSAGSYVWHVSAGNQDDQNARSLAIDSSDNIYVCGSFLGNIDFGTNLVAGFQFRDAYIVKLNSAGTEVWAKDFGIDDEYNDDVNGCAVDGNDDLVAVGSFQRSISFDNGATTLNASGGDSDSDVFIAKFSADGTNVFSQRYGGTDFNEALDVAIEPTTNEVAVAGWTDGPIDFGQSLTNDAGQRGYVVRLSSNLTAHQFSELFTGTDSNKATAVAFHTNGDLLVAGNFKNGITVAGDDLLGSPNDDPFVARYDNNGSQLFAVAMKGDGLDRIEALAVDSQGFPVVVGETFSSDLYVHGETELASDGLADAFAVKLGPDGLGYWGLSFGDSGSDKAVGVAIDGSDNVVLMGQFSQVVDFGGGNATAGDQDLFLVKYTGG